MEDFRSQTVDESKPIDRVRELLGRADDLGESYVENEDPAMGRRFERVHTRIDRLFDELQTLSEPQERSLAESAHAKWEEAAVAIYYGISLPDSFHGDRLDDFHDLIDESGSLVADAYTLNVEEVSVELSALQRRERSQLLTALAILIASSLAAGLLARRVRRSITRPLTSLKNAASAFGSDALSHRIPITGEDELADVSRAFNDMADKLQQSRDALQDLALHDPLTGLPNRRLFMERMEHAIARSDRMRTPFSVLYLDLDGLKAINDRTGHETGDELLVAVAKRLKMSLREVDTPARLGGDEFAVLLEEADLNGATLTAERLSRTFADELTIEGADEPIALSIGIATRENGETLDQLLGQADAAMYAAKASGTGQWQVFRPGLDTDVTESQSQRLELQLAIDREEFLVHYQPVVNLQTEGIVGVEALVRWNHPERGVLRPSEFLEEAEKTDQIVHIDRWVIREACRQVRTWQKARPAARDLFVCVNASARQLQRQGFADEVTEALRLSKLAPEDLIVEITETALVRNTEAATRQLKRLKKLGVKLALDDFGTGYSSLTHLLNFPIDIIKIDSSFVSAIGDEERSKVALALVKLAETLDLKSVAEGIETTDQLDFLRSLNCELGQGYYFAKAMGPLQLEELLNSSDQNVSTRVRHGAIELDGSPHLDQRPVTSMSPSSARADTLSRAFAELSNISRDTSEPSGEMSTIT
jgi:diguanylate cyclase (GGDEF)-like protein